MAHRSHVIMSTLCLQAIAPALLCCISLSCVAETGLVFDKDTGKPIPNAVVLAEWDGVVGAFVEGHSTCFKVEVTRTDELGRFSISSYSWNLNPFLVQRSRSITALAPGYRLSPQTDLHATRIALERQTGTSAEQIRTLGGAGMASCKGAETAVLPYLKELYSEIMVIATTKEDKLRAAHILFEIEAIEMGQDQALARDGKRVQKIKEGA